MTVPSRYMTDHLPALCARANMIETALIDLEPLLREFQARSGFMPTICSAYLKGEGQYDLFKRLDAGRSINLATARRAMEKIQIFDLNAY